jgi:DNA-binding HxlR family transcriptional regulator
VSSTFRVVTRTSGYGQFCPVAKAAEVLCERWTILVVREVLSGSTRFRDIQRGVPGCPPATLSKRLKELGRAGVLQRIETSAGVAYEVTAAGRELYPIVEGFGRWGNGGRGAPTGRESSTLRPCCGTCDGSSTLVDSASIGR